ncbi:MAG TPA: hypothetical protein DHM44_06130 [Flexistipes sinusarabici]|uniref:Uncharacterized protein n=1 Tax=Flexistipes sinusarabici TaxID=2352 RepID=A0A3D5QD79_FLESI|nr:hypothetical protein [Flexistipes sinusarabici]
MKKVLIALVVLLFAVSVYAESRLDLSGQMRVRGKTFENFSDFSDSSDADKESYFDQRLRISGKFNVAEGVSVNFRLDFDEETWGTQGSHGTSVIQTDRAYLELDKDMYRLRAGRQLISLGNYIALDHNGVGFLATLKTPLEITAAYAKVSEGGAKSDESDLNTEDATVYALNLGYNADMANFNVFYGYQDNGKGAGFDELNKSVIGLQADGNFGVVGFNAEYNYYTGENDTTNMDYVGSQFYADLFGNLGIAKVGTELFYAAGTDADDEVQITNLGGGYGLWDDFVPVGTFADSDILDMAVSDYSFHGSFMLGQNAGSMGIAPYVSVSPMDKLNLMANVGYFEPEEDSVTDLDSLVVAVLTADYKLYDSTGLKLQYGYAAPDVSNGGDDDPAQGFYGKLYVNF